MKKEKNTASPKFKLNTKALKYGSFATGFTALVIVLVVLVNIIIGYIGERTNLTIDMTTTNAFDISQESIDYLDNSVDEKIEIVTMIEEDFFKSTTYSYYKQAYEVLQKYDFYSDNIDLVFVDIVKDPTYANKFSELYKGEITANSIVIATENRIKVISVNDLFNTEFSMQTYREEIISSKAEQVLTSAIMYVTDENPITAAILDVETASASKDNIQKMLENNGYNVITVNPLVEAIPTEPEVMIINAPLNDFSEDIITTLYEYMENGGNYGKNLIYLSNVAQKETANIDAFLGEWGIEVGKGILGDTDPNNLIRTNNSFAFKSYIEENDYSENISQFDLPVISYNSRPVNLLFDNNSNVNTKVLLTTEDTSCLITPEIEADLAAGIEPELVNAAYNTMALSQKYTFDENQQSVFSNLLVYGSSEMLNTTFTGASYYNNGDYFISIVNTMVGKEAGIYIVEKDLSAAVFQTDLNIIQTNFVIFMVVIPLAVLVTGIVIFIKRRHK